MFKDNLIPERYRCSVTGQVMIDPVMAADGYTYEREAIEQWLQTHDTSPKTNLKLRYRELTENHDKRSDILKFLDEYPELYTGNEVYLPKSWVAQLVIDLKNNDQLAVRHWLEKDRRLLTLELKVGTTALHLACEFGSPQLVEILLKIFKQRNQLPAPGSIGFKPDYLNILLENALKDGDHAKCTLLLRLGANLEQPEAATQNTLLHRIVIAGNQEAVIWLLDKLQTIAAESIDAQNTKGDTPLHLAVQIGYDGIVSLLLAAGAYPKIKNRENQTAIELAINQQKTKMANLMAQTVRTQTKAKLKEIDRLHQVVVVPAQVSEITELKNDLESYGQSFKTQLLDIQYTLNEGRTKNESLIANMRQSIESQIKQLRFMPPGTATPSIPKSTSPNSVAFHISLAAIPKVDEKDIRELLRLVVEGQQDQAEAMLKGNSDLALLPGNVTDLSRRTFNNITCFQYAVWALDCHMWAMIMKYLPDDAAREQVQGFETGSWVTTHGVHANLNNLIQAYQTVIDLYNAGKYHEGNTAWVQQVGGVQLLLPTHVINEYCHPTRPFYPLPNFKDGLVLPRSRTLGDKDWFSRETLGVKVARVRGYGMGGWIDSICGFLFYDHAAVHALSSTRTAQREELIIELKAKPVQRKAG